MVSAGDVRDVDKNCGVSGSDLAFIQQLVSNNIVLQNITVPAAGSFDEGSGLLTSGKFSVVTTGSIPSIPSIDSIISELTGAGANPAKSFLRASKVIKRLVASKVHDTALRKLSFERVADAKLPKKAWGQLKNLLCADSFDTLQSYFLS